MFSCLMINTPWLSSLVNKIDSLPLLIAFAISSLEWCGSLQQLFHSSRTDGSTGVSYRIAHNSLHTVLVHTTEH